MTEKYTHFGYQDVPVGEKAGRVAQVFTSVAERYDIMNDLMSMGIHRVWKHYAIEAAGLRTGEQVLDVAGGTGDLSARIAAKVGTSGHVTLTDINAAMIGVGRDRLLDRGLVQNISYVQSNAEMLPFADNSFDCITIAFGLRNVTDKQAALNSMTRCLRPGGRLLVLEFSRVQYPAFEKIYDTYSFKLLPWIGEKVANDRDSYQYLVESIRKHPDQETLKGMMETAGLEMVSYNNLSGGVVALHKGYKL